MQEYLHKYDQAHQMSKLDLSFRLTTDLDVDKIHSWLLEQDIEEVNDSFLCNWNLTRNVHDDNQLVVAVLENEPIAYIWENFGILEVRKDYRNKGVGKQLVEYAMKQAQEKGRHALFIESNPESSIPFWRKMGFEFHNKNKASYIFDKSLDMPTDGSAIKVEIQFYPEQAKWNPQISPIKSFSPRAKVDNLGIIHLQYRVAVYVDHIQYGGDAMLKIYVEGEIVYFEKAKYNEAREIGVAFNSDVFYIEKLYNINDAMHGTTTRMQI